MIIDAELMLDVALAILFALAVCLAMTPLVKRFAQKVGAIDMPGEARRVHDRPIPRMGGIAIFLGFIAGVVLFADIEKPVLGMLLGCLVMVATGAIDDIVGLRAIVKLCAQICAALIVAFYGVTIEVIMHPIFIGGDQLLEMGVFSIPITVIWIVAITNAVNLIDGLDGLAVGVSAISSVTMLFIALVFSENNVAIILAALFGACLGFLPYNLNPAKIFMGDTGALLLGFVLATTSVMGMFKTYAIVSVIVPFLALAVPLLDTVFAFTRRLLTGQNPMKPDRGHLHHKLLDRGFTQKQAVALLYAVSAILGLIAMVLNTSGELRVLLIVITLAIAVVVAAFLVRLRITEEAGRRADDGREDE